MKWLLSLERAVTSKGKKRAESKYRNQAVKNVLVAMFNGKCAYCESKIVHVSYGDIEHFRPKSRPEYRLLCFEWTNLLLSCSVCNGSEFKGDRFPEILAGGPPVDPCVGDPQEHLEFIYDPQSGLATVTFKTERGRTSVELFGLNRPRLREHRTRSIRKLYVLSKFAMENGEARALLEQSAEDREEFSAFAKTLLSRLS